MEDDRFAFRAPFWGLRDNIWCSS